jgi:hypothetical protein
MTVVFGCASNQLAHRHFNVWRGCINPHVWLKNT